MWDERDLPATSGPITWGYRRPRVDSPLETLAEERLAARLRWNLPVVRGHRAATEGGGSGAYRVLAPSAFLDDPAASIDVLRVSDWKRFGNAVRQIVNVLHVAERYEAKRVEFPGPHAIFQGSGSGEIKFAWSPPMELPAELARLVPPRSGLDGDFFIVGGLGLKPAPADQARIVARSIRPMVAPHVDRPNADVRDGDVVLHFRGGDVFGSKGPWRIHRDYGQPPLAYYLAAVARERPSRVWLVHEDRRNPAVEAAETELRRQGLEVRMQSGDLAGDLNVLLNAPCLVASFGSFCMAASALSSRARKLYLFGPPVSAHRHLGLNVIEAIDSEGHYRHAATSGNWAASPEQIALMLSYPQSAIAFVDHPPVTSPGDAIGVA